MYFEMSQDNFQKYGVSKWPQVPDGVGGFMSGELLDIPVPEPLVFLVDYTAKHPPVDFVTSFMLTMSDRMVEALQKAGVENIQTFDVILKNPVTDETWTGFKVVNIIGLVSAADLKKSKYENFMEPLCTFEKLVLDTDKANEALFFRLAQDPVKIIVHNHVLDFLYDENNDPLFGGFDLEPIKSSKKPPKVNIKKS